MVGLEVKLNATFPFIMPVANSVTYYKLIITACVPLAVLTAIAQQISIKENNFFLVNGF